MEGNRRLELLSSKGVRDEYGALRFDDATKEMKIVYGRRMDRGGRETSTDNTLGGNWQTRFEIRWEQDISEFSILKDDDDVLWDIVAVNEVPGMPRKTKLWVYAERHQAKLGVSNAS